MNTYSICFRDTRYLLLMTENYAALRVLEKVFPEENDGASVIFGSSFPKDQEFTQVSPVATVFRKKSYGKELMLFFYII